MPMKHPQAWRWPFLEPRRRRMPAKERMPVAAPKKAAAPEVAEPRPVVGGEPDDFSDTLPRVFWPELRG